MIDTPQRRYVDLAPTVMKAGEVARIQADAQQGKRETDSMLGKRYGKSNQSPPVNEEFHLEKFDLIISRTDTRGTITHCNKQFVTTSGWQQEELMGSNHNMIRHPDMPELVYKIMWDTIKSNEEFYGYLKNIRKDGGFYWVFAYVTADFDEGGELVGYTSSRRFAPKAAIAAISSVYDFIRQEEKEHGLREAESIFKNYLSEKGFSSYDQFMLDLQVKSNA